MSYLDKDEVTIWEYKYNDLSVYRLEQRMCYIETWVKQKKFYMNTIIKHLKVFVQNKALEKDQKK